MKVTNKVDKQVGFLYLTKTFMFINLKQKGILTNNVIILKIVWL